MMDEQELPGHEAEITPPEAETAPTETAAEALDRGRIAQDEGRFEAAVAAYEAALELAEPANDDNTMATALFNIGSIQFLHHFWDSARDNFEESFVHYGRANLPEGQADCLMAQAEVEIAAGNLPAAEHLLRTLLPMQQASDQANGRGYTYKRLATLRMHQGDRMGGEEAYRHALLAFETAENAYESADCHAKIGFIYKWDNDWLRALEAFEAALTQAQKAGDELQIHSIQDSIGEVQEKLNPPVNKPAKGLFGRLFGG